MSNAFKKVEPGDSLTIPARAYNSFIDTTLAHQRGEFGGSNVEGNDIVFRFVYLLNSSGAARDRFNVLGLGDPIYSPTDNQNEFENRITFAGATPATATHLGKFAILLKSSPSAKITPAIIAGVCQVKINVVHASHQYADVKNGDATQLESARIGSARILWKESGTGSKWAIVELGALGRGTNASPLELADENEGSETALTDDWDITDQGEDDGLELWQVTRVVYNEAGDKKLYGFKRKMTFDSTGRLVLVGQEVRYEIDSPGACS